MRDSTFFLLVLSSIIGLFLFIKKEKTVVKTDTNTKKPTAQLIHFKEEISYDEVLENDRANIIFIVGEDGVSDNRYYAEAEVFYRNQFDAPIVKTSTSFIDIRDYLESNPTYNQAPWGNIHIVVHSNQWKGIGMPIFPEEERMTADLLHLAMEAEEFVPLDDAVVDSDTKILVQACGLGRNTELLATMSEALGGRDSERPQVISSKYFIRYFNDNGQPQKYLTDVRYAYFKTGYRPSNSELIQQLKQRYPSSNWNWEKALQQSQAEKPEDAFHYFFNVPIEYEMTAKEANLPSGELSQKTLETWIQKQPELMEIIRASQIDFDYFRWRIKRYTFEDYTGKKIPALRIQGKTSVLCVLKSFVDKAGQRPLAPSLEDERFYGRSI